MNEENSLDGTTIIRDFTNGFGIAKLAGIILVLVAVYCGGWLLLLIERFFNDPESLTLLNALTDANFELTFLMNEQVFTFQAPEVLIYGVPIILLLIVIRLTTAFVTMGSQLLQLRSR